MDNDRLLPAVAGQFELMQKRIDERFSEERAHTDARFREERAHTDARFREERAHTDARFGEERAHSDARSDRLEGQIAALHAHMDRRFNDLAESLDILIAGLRSRSPG